LTGPRRGTPSKPSRIFAKKKFVVKVRRLSPRENLLAKNNSLRTIAEDLDNQGKRMPLTYKAERKQLHDMADHLRKRAAELEESGVVRL
jgi:hypothetical protein